MTQAIEVLRSKEVEITEAEAEGVTVAILLHDIGHGPFSHALEHTLLPVHHEELSLMLMQALDEEFDERLGLAIQIFKDEYHKPFLHQLVSGQLDMDRMDYLNRDSFFTGVSEGVIGYDRIIKMLCVKEGRLVVEMKGLYSIEKFLIARRIMYWQVYLHKTGHAAELMLIQTLRRARELADEDRLPSVSPALSFFLKDRPSREWIMDNTTETLLQFTRLDDVDILSALKTFATSEDFILAYLADALLDRRLFKIRMRNHFISSDFKEKLRRTLPKAFPEQDAATLASYFIMEGKESNATYRTHKDEITVIFKNQETAPLSEVSEHSIQPQTVTKYFVCYPPEVKAILK